jgi:23S rRNA pseudouridine1911/1915/1917 synthase
MSPRKRNSLVEFVSTLDDEDEPDDLAPDEDVLELQELDILIGQNQSPERIDRFLSRQIRFVSRSRVQQLIDAGMVLVDELPVLKPAIKVLPGQRVRLSVPRKPKPVVRAERIPLSILYEDEHLLVIDKAAEMVVHPSRGCYTGTLVNALMGYIAGLPEEAGEDFRPGIVHRLDRGTTGLMVVGKSTPAIQALSRMFHDHTIHRLYRAIAWTSPRALAGEVSTDIGRDLRDRLRMAVVHTGRGRHARTFYRTAARYDFLSLLELKLETGRTHQIRVHLEHIGHPVFGDAVYGGRNEKRAGFTGDRVQRARQYLAALDRQALHSWRMGFEHPITGEPMEFEAPMPADMQAIIDGEVALGGRAPRPLTESVFDWLPPAGTRDVTRDTN